mmetsp:Transcript_29941/g.84451  ORF Transcript_29941/g.84451 Transcript_29941/m.84451 type:complete len:149 (-) Transcript_29941:174-620(-)
MDARLKQRMKGALTLLEGELVRKVGFWPGQALASRASALAKLKMARNDMSRMLRDAAEHCIVDFLAQNLANTVEAALKKISAFNTQDLSKTLWAVAEMGHSSPSLFGAVAEAALKKIGTFTAQDLASTALAFATAQALAVAAPLPPVG